MTVIKVEVVLTQEAPSDAQTVNTFLYSWSPGIGWTLQDEPDNEALAGIEETLSDALLATFPENEPSP